MISPAVRAEQVEVGGVRWHVKQRPLAREVAEGPKRSSPGGDADAAPEEPSSPASDAVAQKKRTASAEDSAAVRQPSALRGDTVGQRTQRSAARRPPGTEPTAVLVHGSGSSADSFELLAPLLARRFRVISFDLPGHARTRVPAGYTPDLAQLADSVHALLVHLDCQPSLVVGHSAGAAVLARLTLDGRVEPSLLAGLGAALAPFEGLAGLMLPAAARVLAQPGVAALLSSSVDGALVDRLLRGVGSRLGADGREHYHRLAKSDAHLAGVLAMFANWNLDELAAQLPGLKSPLLLIAGALDRAVPLAQLRRVAGRVPGASLEVIAGAGHLMHEERPREVARLIFDHLDRGSVTHG